MGRTHSVHAEPITFGLKLAGWAFELDRGRRRLADAVDEIATGKISGPGRDVQPPRARTSRRRSSRELGLHVDPASTQIVQRDRHAALLDGDRDPRRLLERFATEIRNLQHTEIGEVMEPFKAGQKGSSRDAPQAQPDPRPSGSRASPGCSAATPARRSRTSRSGTSATSATLGRAGDPARRDDPARLHARPDDRASSTGLVVRARADAREHRARASGCTRSSRVLVALVERGGLSREDAYAIVQRAALRAADERRPLRDLLAVDADGRRRAHASTDLDACFDDRPFLRHVPAVIARLDSLEAAVHVAR